jgi:helix-turn-helix protein, copG
MTTVTLRIPDEKHARLRLLAESRGISVNKLMDEAATVMLAEFDAETRFKTRAARGSASDGLSLLDKALQAV